VYWRDHLAQKSEAKASDDGSGWFLPRTSKQYRKIIPLCFSRILRPLHSTQEILPCEDANATEAIPSPFIHPVRPPYLHILSGKESSAATIPHVCLSPIDSLTDQILLAFIFTPFVSGPVVTLFGSFGGNSLFGRRPWPSGGVDLVSLGISAEMVPGSCFPQFHHSFWAKKVSFFFLIEG